MSTAKQRIKEIQALVGAYPDGLMGNETLSKFQCRYNVPNKAMVAMFFGNVYHETGGFTISEENLNYSPTRMMAIFGVGKHSAKITSAESYKLSGKPYELAERVYGLGNPAKAKELGNTLVGDGYKYRGRGSLQITGKYAYQELQNSGLIKPGDNVVINPELVATKYYWESAINFFNKRNLWNLVSSVSNSDIQKLRRRVNGGLNGIEEVTKMVKHYYSLFR